MALLVIFFKLAAWLILVNAQTFGSKPQEVKVLEGETAVLNCAVVRRDPNVVVMWLNGTSVLTFDRRVLGQDNRVTIIGDNFDLQLEDVTIHDDGTYLCQISTTPPIKQSSILTVNIPASVKLVPEDEREKQVALGDILALHCQAEGKPDPNVTWTRISGKMPTGEKVFSGGLYIAEKVGKDDGGVYQCSADNGYGGDAIQQVKVDIVYAPTVEVEHKVIHTGPGVKTEIKCIFSASPDPEVIWYLNNRELLVAEKNNMVHNKDHVGSDDIFTLVIDGVREDDLGNYTCNGHNNHGAAEASLHLTALPSQTMVKSEPTGQYGSVYTIRWEVTSFPHISEYELKIRMVNESMRSNWSMVNVPGSVKEESALHKMEYKAMDLEPMMNYDVRIRARNKFGWGKWSKLTSFSTADADSTPPPESSVTDEDYNNGRGRDNEDDVITVEDSGPVVDNIGSTAAGFSFNIFSLISVLLVITCLHL